MKAGVRSASIGFARGFAHLHARSGFSYGYGLAHPEELVVGAARLGMDALAITDRDTLAGVPRFMMACAEEDVSPIVGAEISVAATEGGAEDGDGGHLVLLAENMAGYRSLCRLITEYRCSSTNRREPRCPIETVLEHSEGLVCFTGAIPFGTLPILILSGRGALPGGAERIASLLLEAFGQDRLYVELTDDRTMGSRRALGRVAALATEHGLKTVVTNEVVYLEPEDHRLHEVVVAASNLSPLPPPDYRPTDQLHLKSSRKMARLFADYPDALGGAAEISERCAGVVKLDGTIHMPSARLPEGVSAGRRLVELAVKGVREKYRATKEGHHVVEPARVKARLGRELSCIQELGFAPYFLIAHEAAGLARSKGIPVTGRGSAANSLVCHAIGLTQPEPFSNRLLFERFMHEGRKDAPDIDLDFCSLRRDEGIRNPLMERYNEVGTAVAATAITNSLKGAVRIAARSLGYSPTEIDAFSRHVPSRVRDRDTVVDSIETWRRALREPAMRDHPLQDIRKYRMLLQLSHGLNGRLREAGTHLGGMVLGNHQYHLSELVPLEPSGKEGLLRTQYDKNDLEYAGIPKLDLLGLRMHTALSTAGELATKRTGKRIDPYDLPPDDKKTYAMIRRGDNISTFQLESPGQLHLSRRLKPRRFSDLVAQISLFRPGPVRGDLVTPYILRSNGEEPYSVPLPHLLDEVLRPTYGVVLFQEQILEICRKVAGFTLAEGDEVRRAMTALRGPGALKEVRARFIRRAANKDVPPDEAERIFSWVENFASYGFSAAHAASFAEISYASAYMKAHYPAEFFTGILNAQPMGFYSPRVLLNEARRGGVEVLPLDINLSGDGFTVEKDGTAIRVGLRYTRGLSRKAIDSILAERSVRPFSSLADLHHRGSVEKDGLENLVRGGFLDSISGLEKDTGAPTSETPGYISGGRHRMLDECKRLPKKKRPPRKTGDILLDIDESPYPDGGWNLDGYVPLTAVQEEKMEWESLGLNVRRHPLSPYRAALGDLGVTESQDTWSLPHGTRARVAGLMECLQRPPTRSGRSVYFLMVEDESGLLQSTIFRRTYERYGHVLHQRSAYLLEGRVEQDRKRGFSFVVQKIEDLVPLLAGKELPAAPVFTTYGTLVRTGAPA